MEYRSKILVIGATGRLGQHLVMASVEAGHPSFALVRETSLAEPAKAKIIDNFRNLGVNILCGDVLDRESLVKAIKQVDVVISAVGHMQWLDQVGIIDAIKEAGNNIKRFFPSEFGVDVDRVHGIEPAKSTIFAMKKKIRRLVEAEGIPYTFIAANCFAEIFLSGLNQPHRDVPPRDKALILTDGNTKVVYNRIRDVATYTIRSVDDPRTLNKILYIKPPDNIYSFNELISLWEKKIGHALEKIYVPEEQFLKDIQEASFPDDMELAIIHSIYVMGDETNFEIDPSFGVEASRLYPDVKYTTAEEFVDQFV